MKHYYSSFSHKGAIDGNLVEAYFFYNHIAIRIKVRHRVSQTTAMELDKYTARMTKLFREPHRNYDVYQISYYGIPPFSYEEDFIDLILDGILRIDRFISFESGNINKISEELNRILG